jgi:hypothetical protein
MHRREQGNAVSIDIEAREIRSTTPGCSKEQFAATRLRSR